MAVSNYLVTSGNAHYHGEVLRKPSAPIPIPNVHRVTHPPPPSPTRFEPSSDLIFEMSPHVATETPLTQHRDPLQYSNTNMRFPSKPVLNFASRFGHVKDPARDRPPPYWDEPYLYSVPRSPLQRRNESSRYNCSDVTAVNDESQYRHSTSFVPSSAESLSPLRKVTSKTKMAKPSQDSLPVLTKAFQQSFATSTEFTHSSQSPSSLQGNLHEPLSPPQSPRDWTSVKRSLRKSPIRHRRTMAKSSGLSGVIRTSAAEPVVSFAQAELKHSPGSGVLNRVVKASRTTAISSRARSPYPVVRGRKNSAYGENSLKISDEDLLGTFNSAGPSEKFGLEKFLLDTPFPKGRAVDENVYGDDENMERGRTRSRVRGGRRA